MMAKLSLILVFHLQLAKPSYDDTNATNPDFFFIKKKATSR